MKQEIWGNELLELGRMLERGNGNATKSSEGLGRAKNQFSTFVRDLAGGVRSKGLRASAVKRLSSSKSRLPEDCCAVLDLSPGSTFAEAIIAGRALRVLAQAGEDLIKRRGDYFIRGRREGRVFRVYLFRLGREMGLLRTSKGAGRAA